MELIKGNNLMGRIIDLFIGDWSADKPEKKMNQGEVRKSTNDIRHHEN